MFKSIEKPKTAVIGLSLEFYKKAVPGVTERYNRQLRKFAAEISKFAEIKSQKLCCLRNELFEEIKAAEQKDVDTLLLIPMCYTASLVSLPPLIKTKLPLVIWNTQEAVEFNDSFDFDTLVMNHVAQGTQDVTNVLTKNNRLFGMESGHYQDKKALDKLSEWLTAARAAKFARNLRVGRLGGAFQDMGDFEVDNSVMTGQWGPCVINLKISRFIELIKSVKNDEINKVIARDRKKYEVDAGVTSKLHKLSAKLELALRTLIKENRLDAFTMNFAELIEDGRCGTIPFLGLNKMLEEGLGYAGEGDTLTAALMAQNRQLCGAANFTEIYTLDYKTNRMMMTHMQECNPALAGKNRKIKLVKKDFWAPGIQPYVGMHFTLEPGPVTLVAVTSGKNGGFTYVLYETEVADIIPFSKFDIPHWVIQLSEPVGGFLTRYSMAGGPHHLTAIPGRRKSVLKKLAGFQGFNVKDIQNNE